MTDCARKRDWESVMYNFQLGGGYPTIIAGRLLNERPQDDLKFLNRGISGNRIVDLWPRWKEDCLNLKPNVLSLLVGVNDTAHEWHFQKGVKPTFSKRLLTLLLDYTLDALPDVKLVLGQPFVFPFGLTPEKDVFQKAWVEEMEERAGIVKEVSEEYHTLFVPYWDIFKKKLDVRPMEYWIHDGVHPTVAGQQVMADAWVEVVQK